MPHLTFNQEPSLWACGFDSRRRRRCQNKTKQHNKKHMKKEVKQLLAILTPSNWCRGYWYRRADNTMTLNTTEAAKFDLIGAMYYLFDASTANKLKRFLQNFLFENEDTFLKHLREENGVKKPLERTDFGNLAKFNDEINFYQLQSFLQAASN